MTASDTSTEPSPRRSWIRVPSVGTPAPAELGLLIGAVAVALGIRLVAMGHPLLPDEGYTWLVGSAPNPSAFLRRLAIYENTPPLYYLLLTPLPLNSAWWIRLPTLISGVALVGILYATVRPTLGRGTALLAALGLAIAPYAVAESNFGRGFMLADAALLVCFAGAVRLAEGRSPRWWWVYGLGAIVAIYSEYNAALTLIPIVFALVWLRPDRRWPTLGLAVLPAAALIPWIPQLARSINDLDVTKTGIGYLTVTPASIRHQLVTLYLGSTGANLSPAAQTLALLILIGVVALGVPALIRRGPVARPLLILTGAAGLGTLVLTALAPAFGVGIFNVGYLTILIPLGVIPAAAAVAALTVPRVIPIAATALLILGIAFGVKRSHQAPDISPTAIASVLDPAHVRTILTNSAVVTYYFRDQGAILDRPFGLGAGLEQRCAGCAPAVAVVDDANVGLGARPGPGTPIRIGHYVVRILPPSASR